MGKSSTDLYKPVRSKVGLKHAPGAPDVFIGENYQTFSRPVDAVHNVLHDGLAWVKVSLVVADGYFVIFPLQDWD